MDYDNYKIDEQIKIVYLNYWSSFFKIFNLEQLSKERFTLFM